MSRLGPYQLTARKVETAKDGVYADGGNLWLIVGGKSRRWSVRFTSPITGKRREMGIGSVRDVPLAEAREEAAAARKLLRSGKDPLDERNAKRAAVSPKRGKAFREVALSYVEEQTPGWRDPRLPAIWTSSLTRLAFPAIGDSPVDAVTTDDILRVLRPIWATTNETADRVRGRLERILDYARTQGWREGENPARWKGHLAHILPKPSSVTTVKHRPAVPWSDISPVMASLAEADGVSAKAVRFACLTVARSKEVRGASWSEIDFKARMWTIPPGRMKSKREHRVPLSAAALDVLNEMRVLGTTHNHLVFPGARANRPLSDVAVSKALHMAAGTTEVTVHGLRSSFRDWASEATDYPGEMAEMALAHAISDKVEAAYRRGDLLEKRREMMEAWANHCGVSRSSQGAWLRELGTT